MNKMSRFTLLPLVVLVLSACNPSFPSTPTQPVTSVVKLTVQTQNGVTTFSTLGQVINYNYVVTNTETAPLAGPVIIADPPRQVACPEMITVGNFDNYLDLNETINCTSAYTISQSDINNASVINMATATVGGVISNQSGVTLTLSAVSTSMTLTKTANPSTYSQIGQTIIYVYVITNTGTTPLGPAQFTISDHRLGAPLNCGPDATTLAANQNLACSVAYVITQADMNVVTLTNSATASGGGQTSAPASVTITNLANLPTQAPAP